jgi:hypothetical protein
LMLFVTGVCLVRFVFVCVCVVSRGCARDVRTMRGSLTRVVGRCRCALCAVWGWRSRTWCARRRLRGIASTIREGMEGEDHHPRARESCLFWEQCVCWFQKGTFDRPPFSCCSSSGGVGQHRCGPCLRCNESAESAVVQDRRNEPRDTLVDVVTSRLGPCRHVGCKHGTQSW